MIVNKAIIPINFLKFSLNINAVKNESILIEPSMKNEIPYK